MATLLSYAPFAAILFHAASAAATGRLSAAAARRTATAASALALAAGLAAGAGAFMGAGGVELALGGVAVSTIVDPLSAMMLALVGVVGFAATRYSRAYLDGDPRQPVFLARLGATLAAVTALVSAGDLATFAAAWIATSLALHLLLVYRSERPAAVRAARKKFVFARLGDAALLAAFWLIRDACGTSDIRAIAEAAQAGGADLTAPALLIAAAAIVKSAQFPVHGWLIEVMETPTPVSALLHAGVVNAGGFLVLRFADVAASSGAALATLAIVGGGTALFGSAAMLAQPAVKTRLACSTVSQMGFMLMQCGLGAFAPAALHIAAHSLYKAHAFLSAGEASSRAPVAAPAPSARRAALAATTAGAAFAAAVAGLAALGHGGPVPTLLAAIYAAGLFAVLARTGGGAGAYASVAAGAILYVALQAAFGAAFSQIVPGVEEAGPAGVALGAFAAASFLAVALLQAGVPRIGGRLARSARIHLENGLYADVLIDRLLGAFDARPAATDRA